MNYFEIRKSGVCAHHFVTEDCKTYITNISLYYSWYF